MTRSIHPVMVGTAGHIDHGKSSLVRSLTGVDPDRLKEEKERGLTIDLGFAPLTMADGRLLGMVDVPGHERFVRNMVAGSSGLDLAILVVAADDSVMPQTREHLNILHLLGVKAGIVALTKIDLVDAEIREFAADEITELLQGTCLEGAAIAPLEFHDGRGRRCIPRAAGVAGEDRSTAKRRRAVSDADPARVHTEGHRHGGHRHSALRIGADR